MIFLLIFLLPFYASATPRTIVADQIQSSDLTKLWLMPIASGTLMTTGGAAGTFWNLNGNAGTGGTATLGTTDAQPWSTIANGIFVDAYGIDGAISSIQNIVPADGVSRTQRNAQTNLTPGVDTTTANNTLVSNALDYAGGFNYGGNIVTQSSRFQNVGTGTLNYGSVLDNSALFNGGGTTSLFKGNNLDVQVNGANVTNYEGVNSYMSMTNSTIDGLNMYNSNAQLTNVTGNNTVIDGHTMVVAGTSVIAGGLNGYNAQVVAQDTAAINDLRGLNINSTVQNASQANGLTGGSFNVSVNDTAQVTGFVQGLNSNIQTAVGGSTVSITGFNNGMTLAAPMASGQGLNGENINFQIASTVTGLNYLNGIAVNGNIDAPLTAAHNMTTIGANYNFTSHFTVGFVTNLSDFSQFQTGSQVLGGYQGLTIGANWLPGAIFNANYQGASVNSQFDGQAGITNVNAFNANMGFGATTATTLQNYYAHTDYPNFHAHAAMTEYKGVELGPNWDAGSTIVKMSVVDVHPNAPSSPMSGNEANGVRVEMNNVHMADPTQFPNAIDSDGGHFNANFSADLTASLSGVFWLHSMGGQFHIMPGVPQNGGVLAFGNANFPTFFAEDDMGPDFTGLHIGYSGVISAGQTGVLTGKTVDSINQVIAASSIPAPSTGGTISNFSMFRAAGLLPSGGSLVVTNMYGYRTDSLLCTFNSNGNCWNLYDQSGAENFLGKLAIGTGTFKVANASTALEIGNNEAFLNGRGTTVQKNALTPLAGMQFYDTTLQQLQWYNGTAWVTASGAGGGPTPFQEAPTPACDGVTTVFNLTNPPVAVANSSLFKNGMILNQGSDYTIAGTVLTLSTACLPGETLYDTYSY